RHSRRAVKVQGKEEPAHGIPACQGVRRRKIQQPPHAPASGCPARLGSATMLHASRFWGRPLSIRLEAIPARHFLCRLKSRPGAVLESHSPRSPPPPPGHRQILLYRSAIGGTMFLTPTVPH